MDKEDCRWDERKDMLCRMIKENWGEWLKIYRRERQGGRYEHDRGGWDSGTGEWAFGIGGGDLKRNPRVRTDKGEDQPA